MKKVFVFIAMALLATTGYAQTKWNIDPAHSFVNFSVKHLGISFVNGGFKKFDGSYTSAEPDLSDARIFFKADAASISTGVDQRDTHLKTDDFLNAEKFSELKFESNLLKKVNGNEYLLTGKLTIRDVTKDVTFKVIYGGVTKDSWGNTKSGFTVSTVINRFDYNVKYDPTGLGVAKEVAINLNLEFIQAK
jgi:polyisoprenoid-binding protein YceI